MKSDEILHADVLDIIFEHRNKNYGAYALRKFYNSRLYKAMGMVLTIVCLLTALLMMPQNKMNLAAPIILDRDSLVTVMHEEPHAPKPKDVLMPQNHAAPKQILPTQVFSTPLIITTSTTQKISTLDSSAAIDTKTAAGIPGSSPVVKPAGPETHAGSGFGETDPAPDRNTPTNFAEVMPAFPGGVDALRKFLEKNLRNPRDGEVSAEVWVKVQFVVGFDGALKSFQIVQDGGRDFNNEVLRVLKKMPQWIPGKTRGQNVSVYYSLPVMFAAATD